MIGADHLVITESALDVVEGSPARAQAEKPAAEKPAEEPAPKVPAPAKASTGPQDEAETTTEAEPTTEAEAGSEAE